VTQLQYEHHGAIAMIRPWDHLMHLFPSYPNPHLGYYQMKWFSE